MPFLTFDGIVTRTLLPNPDYLLIFNMMMTTRILSSLIHAPQINRLYQSDELITPASLTTTSFW